MSENLLGYSLTNTAKSYYYSNQFPPMKIFDIPTPGRNLFNPGKGVPINNKDGIDGVWQIEALKIKTLICLK